ncbi:hypothetical protein ACH4T9_04375 [Micromonospora sp. NPDC020750]|uniref:hypothetical protein n=1 Tax=unclassified Micromonospora TaxID=2617518 RepID=UPI0037AEF1ED
MSLNLDKSTWKRVRLGDVIRRSRTQVDPTSSGVERYVAGGHVDSEGVTIERWGQVGDGQMGSTFRYVFQPGQALFVSARPYLRKVGVPDFAGVVADKTYVLDAVPENGLLQEFLPFVLSSEEFVEYATTEATGSMNPRLLWGPMQRYELDLPPLDEQWRLASLLWSIERHRGALRRLANAASPAVDGVLSCEVVSGGQSIREIADVLVGFAFPSVGFSDEASESSRPLLRGINIGIGETRWGSSDTVHWRLPLTAQMSKYALTVGDVVIPMDRPFTAAGHLRWAELQAEEDGALLVQRVARLRPRDRSRSPLLRAIVRSSGFQRSLSGSLTGSFAPHLAHGDFASFLFTVPDPDGASSRLIQAEWAEQAISTERSRAADLADVIHGSIFGGVK